MSRAKSLKELIETGSLKEDKAKVIISLNRKSYDSLMDIIHDKEKDVSKRMTFSYVIEYLIQAILDDRVMVLGEKEGPLDLSKE